VSALGRKTGPRRIDGVPRSGSAVVIERIRSEPDDSRRKVLAQIMPPIKQIKIGMYL
jgi:hypothetical protein